MDASQVKARVTALGTELPEVMAAFAQLQGAATRSSALDAKTKRLVMVGIAVTQRCPECLAVQVAASLEAGATRAEILDAAGVAILMGGGPAVAVTATRVIDLLDRHAALSRTDAGSVDGTLLGDTGDQLTP